MDIATILLIIGGLILTVLIALLGYFGVPWWNKNRQKDDGLNSWNINTAKQKDPSLSSVSASADNANNSGAAVSSPASDSNDAADDDSPEAGEAGEGAEASSPPAIPIQQGSLQIEDFSPPALPEPPRSLLHAKEFCYVIQFYGEHPIEAKFLQQLCDKLAQGKIHFYRQLGFDENSREWQLLQSSYRYVYLVFPLANRSGKLEKTQIKLIEDEGRRFADKMKIKAVFPDVASAVGRADVLDNFCEAVDIIIECRLQIGGKFTLEQVNQCLSLSRLVVSGKEAVYRKDSEEIFKAKLILGDNQSVRTVLFMLDVPKVTRPLQAFDDMMTISDKIAKSLNAEVTDSYGKAISTDRISTIKRQLVGIVKQMNDNDVPPGGALSHLLFS